MPFTPGHPKYGGRKKGTANKVSLRTRDELWAYIDKLVAEGHAANPFHVLVDTMLSSPLERVQCAIALADRLLPKLKAVELSGDPEKPLSVVERLTPEQRDREIRRLMLKYMETMGITPPPELLAQTNGHAEGTP